MYKGQRALIHTIYLYHNLFNINESPPTSKLKPGLIKSNIYF